MFCHLDRLLAEKEKNMMNEQIFSRSIVYITFDLYAHKQNLFTFIVCMRWI